MKVRTLTLQAGPDGVVQPGTILDVPEELARHMIAEKYAEAVELEAPDPPARESAAVTPPEKAVLPAARPRSPFRRQPE